MTPHLHAVQDRIADTYWRYVARHELVLSLWQRHRTPRDRYVVLDVGCGSGALLAFLSARDGAVPVGVDHFTADLAACRRRGVTRVSGADGTALPFRSGAVDLVVAQDVAEHVPDDGPLLAELFRVCAPGGLALVLVPAFAALWSTRDLRLGHYRRYTLGQLAERMRAAGFRVVRETYTDLALYVPLRAAVTLARRADGVPDLPMDAPGGSGAVNRVLLALSRLEAFAIRRTRLPFGVSALVLAVRPGAGR